MGSSKPQHSWSAQIQIFSSRILRGGEAERIYSKHIFFAASNYTAPTECRVDWQNPYKKQILDTWSLKLHDADACLYMDRWTYVKCVEMRCVASIFAQSLAHIDKAAAVAVEWFALEGMRCVCGDGGGEGKVVSNGKVEKFGRFYIYNAAAAAEMCVKHRDHPPARNLNLIMWNNISVWQCLRCVLANVPHHCDINIDFIPSSHSSQLPHSHMPMRTKETKNNSIATRKSLNTTPCRYRRRQKPVEIVFQLILHVLSVRLWKWNLMLRFIVDKLK